MSQILFVVEVPPSKALSSSPGYPHEWTSFENEIESKLGSSSSAQKTAKACTRLQTNAWLIPAENSWQFLDILVASATSHNLPYSVLLVSGEVTHLTLPPKKP